MNPFERRDVTPQPSKESVTEKSGSRKKIRERKPEGEQVNLYDVPLDPSHPLIEAYHPKMIGRGGEHVVFEVPELPNDVVKVEKKAIADILEAAGKEGKVPSEEELLRDARANLERQRELFAKLKQHFGAEHVLEQTKMLMQVPLTEGLVGDLEKEFGTRIPMGRRAVWTIVTIQQRTSEAEHAKEKSFSTGGLVEPRHFLRATNEWVRDEYDDNTTDLMNAETARHAKVTLDDFEYFLDKAPLTRLLRKAEDDPGLKEALRDFSERAAAFAQETGEMLDVAGKENIIFFKKEDGSWTYKLIDPFYGFTSHILERGRSALRILQRGGDVFEEPGLFNALLQSINFTRTINGVGHLTGAKTFYDFLPTTEKEVPNMGKILFAMATGHLPIEKERGEQTVKRKQEVPTPNTKDVTKKVL